MQNKNQPIFVSFETEECKPTNHNKSHSPKKQERDIFAEDDFISRSRREREEAQIRAYREEHGHGW